MNGNFQMTIDNYYFDDLRKFIKLVVNDVIDEIQIMAKKIDSDDSDKYIDIHVEPGDIVRYIADGSIWMAFQNNSTLYPVILKNGVGDEHMTSKLNTKYWQWIPSENMKDVFEWHDKFLTGEINNNQTNQNRIQY